MNNGELDDLKVIIAAPNDLVIYADDDDLLNYALRWAANQINLRRGYKPKKLGGYEAKYRYNVIQGAVDYLSRIGGSEVSSTNENGISTHFREVPAWLQSVTPKLGVY